MSLTIHVLADNNTIIDQYLLGEPALSLYIEADGRKILFDTGYSDVFYKNAKILGLSLEELDMVVLSHGHNDHTGGLPYLTKLIKNKRLTLVAHPEVFSERVCDGLQIGSPIHKAGAEECFSLKLSDKPVWLTDRLVFLGEIPGIHSFEPKQSVGMVRQGDQWNPDYLTDDSALAYIGDEGLYIITGCSHRGICNIISYAVSVCGRHKLAGLIGGLHLFELNQHVREVIRFLQHEKITQVYPCHCTSLLVKAEMLKVMPVYEVGAGLKIEWL